MARHKYKYLNPILRTLESMCNVKSRSHLLPGKRVEICPSSFLFFFFFFLLMVQKNFIKKERDGYESKRNDTAKRIHRPPFKKNTGKANNSTKNRKRRIKNERYIKKPIKQKLYSGITRSRITKILNERRL